MNKWKVCMWISILTASILWTFMFIVVSYFLGYDQCAIDKGTADFSAPAYVNIFNAIPWLLGIAVFGGLAVFFYHKNKQIKDNIRNNINF